MSSSMQQRRGTAALEIDVAAAAQQQSPPVALLARLLSPSPRSVAPIEERQQMAERRRQAGRQRCGWRAPARDPPL